jgi:hypothetical protein
MVLPGRSTQTPYGVLCLQNVTLFQGTRADVISFTPVTKYGIPCAHFHRTHELSTLRADLHRISPISSKRGKWEYPIYYNATKHLLLSTLYIHRIILH